MTEEIKDRIIGDIEEMTRLAEQYGAATTEILTTDIDETLEEIVERRGEITELVGQRRRDIDDACSQCTDQERDLIIKMITGGHVPLGISKEMRDIHKAAVKMHSTYLSIGEKEQKAAARVDARVKELRTELENVNSGRKITNGYSAVGTGLGESGGSFDGRL